MKHFALGILITLSIFACKKSDEINFPVQLDQAIENLTKSMDTLNNELSGKVVLIAGNTDDTTFIRAKCLEMYNQSSFVDEFSFITSEGILQIVEPSEYYSSQGIDISQQDHIVKAFQTKMPVLSKTFDLTEGYNGVVDIHPIVSNNQVLGAISSVFVPKVILGRIIKTITYDQAYEIWVLEKGGVLLYDEDEAQIGLNIFTDPFYDDFPDLVTAAGKIDAEDSGETSYSFYQTGSTNIITKKAYWKTFKMYGNEWKLIWVVPI